MEICKILLARLERPNAREDAKYDARIRVTAYQIIGSFDSVFYSFDSKGYSGRNDRITKLFNS